MGKKKLFIALTGILLLVVILVPMVAAESPSASIRVDDGDGSAPSLWKCFQRDCPDGARGDCSCGIKLFRGIPTLTE